LGVPLNTSALLSPYGDGRAEVFKGGLYASIFPDKNRERIYAAIPNAAFRLKL